MYMCARARVLAHTEINVFEKELLAKQTKTKQTNERVEDITKKKTTLQKPVEPPWS